jgi:hypothetical protein
LKHLRNISNYEEDDPNFRRRASYAKNTIECYPEWPLCIYDLNYKYNLVNYLVFRVMSPPIIINDYFFKYLDTYRKNTKNINVNLKKQYSRVIKNKRKSSNSSEGFEKIGFENLNDNEDNIVHIKSKSQRVTKNSIEASNDLFEFKMRMYSNLLIERRKHYCSNSNVVNNNFEENFIDEQIEKEIDQENSDLVEVYVDNKYEIVESYIRLKSLKLKGQENIKGKSKIIN